MELQSFCFDHAGMFVIPAECIGPAGLDPAFVDAMLRAGRASPEWAARLGEVVRQHDDALRSLHRRARAWWFPPRRQNLCVVEAPTTTRPFYQPIDGASWLLVASDYEPSTSSLAFGVFMLLQAERLALKRSPGIALVHNLSWLLTLDDAAREDFCAGALRCTRPDAEAWRAVAEAMPWIGGLHHVQLRPAVEGLVTIEGAGLQVSPEDIARLEGLADRVDQVSTRWIEAYARPRRSGRPSSSAADVVIDDLRDRRPPIVVVMGVDPGDEPLWDPEHPDRTDRLHKALAATPEPVAISLRDDLRRIETRTEQFLDWIVDRDALPRSSEDLDCSGGVYVEAERQLVVVGLVQPGLDARTEAGPPFHRWLVAARTVHEWAHLAVDAGAIAVPPANATAYDRAVEHLVQTVEHIVDRGPSSLRTQVGVHSVARHYVERQLRRMPDYLANVLASRILPVHEMEAYVRVNVRSLARDRLGLLERLIRYAYEVQYLGLSRMPDPMRYFLGTTWFAEQYLEPAVVQADAVEAMFAAMGRVCGSFVIDPARFRSPGRAAQPGSQPLAGSNSLSS